MNLYVLVWLPTLLRETSKSIAMRYVHLIHTAFLTHKKSPLTEHKKWHIECIMMAFFFYITISSVRFLKSMPSLYWYCCVLSVIIIYSILHPFFIIIVSYKLYCMVQRAEIWDSHEEWMGWEELEAKQWWSMGWMRVFYDWRQISFALKNFCRFLQCSSTEKNSWCFAESSAEHYWLD